MNPSVTLYSLFLTHSLFYFPFLEKEMAAPSSILAWKIPWTEELGRLQPIAFQLESESASVSCSVCLSFREPTDCSLLGSSVHGILQARILEWVAIPFSRGSFPMQGSNLGLLHCRWVLCHLSHQGSIQSNYSTQNINSSS